MSLTWDQALVSIAQRNNHRLPSGDFVSFRPDGSVAAGVSPSPAATTGSRTEAAAGLTALLTRRKP